MASSCLYMGEVVHKRLSPLRHELRYRVFNLFADVDELPVLHRRLRLFSYNRFNVFSLFDTNHGPGDGTAIGEHAWKLMRCAEGGDAIARIFMFCYPRVLGYVFNPLTVYYGFDADGQLRMMIYEVNNTFGGRHSYVLPVHEGELQTCVKGFYVSPFNAVEGRYSFHFNSPGRTMALGVNLSVGGQPVLKAYVSGERLPLSDGALLRSFVGFPLLTLKVIAAIHWQAAKLFCKGLRIRARPDLPLEAPTPKPEIRSAP